MATPRIVDRHNLDHPDFEVITGVTAFPDPPLTKNDAVSDLRLSVDDWVLVELAANEGTVYPAFNSDMVGRLLLDGVDGSIPAKVWLENCLSSWKESSGTDLAAKYESTVARALGIRGEIRKIGGCPTEPVSDGRRRIVELYAALSDLYLESFFDEEIELYRGLSYRIPEILKQILEDLPYDDGDIYSTRTTALVNFTIDEQTAKKYGALYVSRTFLCEDIPLVPDGVYYERDNLNSDGEFQVKGTAFEAVEVDELRIPETGEPLSETFAKLAPTESVADAALPGLTIAEHQVFAGTVLKLATKEMQVQHGAGTDALQQWADALCRLSTTDLKTIFQWVKDQPEAKELEISFLAAVDEVTESDIKMKLDASAAELF